MVRVRHCLTWVVIEWNKYRRWKWKRRSSVPVDYSFICGRESMWISRVFPRKKPHLRLRNCCRFLPRVIREELFPIFRLFPSGDVPFMLFSARRSASLCRFFCTCLWRLTHVFPQYFANTLCLRILDMFYVFVHRSRK